MHSENLFELIQSVFENMFLLLPSRVDNHILLILDVIRTPIFENLRHP
jgi:hypothetical protein